MKKLATKEFVHHYVVREGPRFLPVPHHWLSSFYFTFDGVVLSGFQIFRESCVTVD
jgi:hypothetical protein